MSSRAGSDFRAKYLRQLPAIGKMMEHPELKRVSEKCPRVLLVNVTQAVVEAHKTRILAASDEAQIRELDTSLEHMVEEVSNLAAEKAMMSLRRAINATGDVLCERLGRAPLSEAAYKAIGDIAVGYSTLAVDTQTGEPSDRNAHIRDLLSMLTGAEAGLVVNNNAAAVMLILNTVADGKEVIVSRGQLIEADGFRLPDVVAQSGAQMMPVGTTNKTHLRDYSDAIGEKTGAILTAHKSNYRIVGFAEDVPVQKLVQVGREHNLPVIDDIGVGCLVDLAQYGLQAEPSAFSSIRSGADIVCFSGDKLLGGPQAGVVIGGQKYISMMKQNSLYRMLRADKLVIAALEATLRLYLDADRILEANLALRFLSRSLKEIESMARSLADSLAGKLSGLAVIRVEDGCSRVGSVSAAPEKFPTKLVSVKPTQVSVGGLEKRLRSLVMPVFTLVSEEHLLIDLRTVSLSELDEIAAALVECCQP